MNLENQTPKQFPHESRTIAIAEITVVGHNARKVNAKSPGIKDLAENIKATGGILQPVLLRKVAIGYELLAGHRRVAASLLAGFTEIKAEVYQVDDADAQLITVTENLQRQDLTPLEEAAAIKTLINTGKDLKTIAADLGRPASWVLRRARLTTLTPEWLMALAGKEPPKQIKELADIRQYQSKFIPEIFSDWPVTALELIARYEPEGQNKLLAEIIYNHGRQFDDVNELGSYLAQFTHQLKKAPWKLDDDSLLPKAGACSSCPKRSSHTPGLFDDDQTSENISDSDKCLDISCWSEKLKANYDRRISKLSTEHPDLVKITEGWDNHQGVINCGGFTEVKKSDKGAVPAIVVDGNSQGQLKWVHIHGSTPKAARPKGKDGKPKAASKEERYQKLADRRNAHVIEAIQVILKSDIFPVAKDARNFPVMANNAEKIAALAAAFGIKPIVEWDPKHGYINDDPWKKYEAVLADKARFIHHVWDGMRLIFRERLNFSDGHQATQNIPEAKKILALLELEFEPFMKAAEAEIPVPKSWAKLDGEEAPAKPKAKVKPKDKPAKATPDKAAKTPKAKKIKRGSLLKKSKKK